MVLMKKEGLCRLFGEKEVVENRSFNIKKISLFLVMLLVVLIVVAPGEIVDSGISEGGIEVEWMEPFSEKASGKTIVEENLIENESNVSDVGNFENEILIDDLEFIKDENLSLEKNLLEEPFEKSFTKNDEKASGKIIEENLTEKEDNDLIEKSEEDITGSVIIEEPFLEKASAKIEEQVVDSGNEISEQVVDSGNGQVVDSGSELGSEDWKSGSGILEEDVDGGDVGIGIVEVVDGVGEGVEVVVGDGVLNFSGGAGVVAGAGGLVDALMSVESDVKYGVAVVATSNITSWGNGTHDYTSVNVSGYLTLVKGVVVDNQSSGLVGLWNFDNGTNDNLSFFYDNADRHRNNGSCVLSANDCPNVSKNGKFGRALEFDGVDDEIIISSDISLNSTRESGEFTISAWVNIPSIDSVGGGYIAYENQEFRFRSSTNDFNFDLYNASGWETWRCITNLMTANNWLFVVGTYDYSSDNASCYLNGEIKASKIIINATLGNYSNTMYIGSDGSSAFLNGTIDEVAIWNRSLGASEIRNLYENHTRQGNYTSAIINATYNASWNNISWSDGFKWNDSDPEINSSDKGLVGLWHFNNNSVVGDVNGTAYDSHQGKNNGTLDEWHTSNSQPTYNAWNGTGKIGSGLKFDGVDDYVEVADDDSLSFGNGTDDFPFSVSVWVNPNELTTDGVIFAKYQSPYEYNLFLDSNEKPYIILRDDSAAVNTQVYWATSFSIGTWTHLVYTYDGTGGATAGNGIRIYINGINKTTVVSNNAGYVAMENTANSMLIGARSVSGLYDFNGTLDEVKIWNISLNASQILDLYRNESIGIKYPAMNTSNLVGEWTFNESTGNTALDSADGRNNGTLTGYTRPLLSSGKFGNAYTFDGVDDYVVVPHTSSQNTSSAVTYNVWIKPSSVSSNVGHFITKSANIYFRTDLTELELGLNFGPNNFTKSSGANLQVGNWYMATFTYDKDAGDDVAHLYLNGVETAYTTQHNTNGEFIEVGVIDISIGRRSDAGYFNGTIDEVAIWNRSLSADEIKQLYRNSIGHIRTQFRSCNDALCEGENFTGPDGKVSSYYTDNFSVLNSSSQFYGQYKIFMNSSYYDTYSNKTPYLSNVFVGYEDSMSFELLNPVSYWNTSSVTGINFTYTISSSGTVGNCSLFLTNVDTAVLRWNKSDTSITEGKNQSLNVTALTEGNYSWLINCVETQGYSVNSSKRYFNIDNQVPNVSIGRPVNWFNSSSVTIEMNISVKDRNVKNVTVRGNWSGEVSNVSSGLVGLWHMNNETQSGSVAENETYIYDFSGNNNNGSYFGSGTGGYGGTSDGKFGNAMTFDGVDDYVDTPQITLDDNFTIAFWAKPNAKIDYTVIIDDGGETYGRGGVMLYGGYWQLFETQVDGGELLPTTSLNLNEWQFVAFTQDGKTATAYFNGEQEATDTTFEPIDQVDAIGFGSGTGEFDFNGTIDEVAIWNKSLTALEIKQLYQASSWFINNSGVSDDYNFTFYVDDKDNTYAWNVTVCDFSSNCNTSVWNFTVDTLVPNLSIGRLDNGTYLRTRMTEFNFSVEDRNLKNLTFYGNFSNEVDNGSSGLVGLWHFNNGSNDNLSFFYDEADRHRNNGSCVMSANDCPNVTYNGKFGRALSFDGVDDYVSVGNVNDFNMSEGTIAFWIKRNDETGYEDFFYIYETGGTTTDYFVIRISTDSFDDKIQISIEDENVVVVNTNTVNSVLTTANTWYHVAIIQNGTNFSIYVDGNNQPMTGTSNGNFTSHLTSWNTWLGKSIWRGFNGTIDEVAIWNRSLSASEIQEMYKTSRYYNSSGVSDEYNVTWDSFVDGKHKWNVSVCDHAGNCNSTGYRWFYSDTVIPNLSWVAPTPLNDSHVDIDSVYLNTSVIDSSNTTAWFDWNNSLVGYWSFDEYNTSGVYDNSSYNNFGSFNSMDENDRRFGKFGYGFEFDGVDDYVEVGTWDSTQINQSLTVSAWIYPTQIDDKDPIVGSTGASPFNWVFRFDAPSYLELRAWNPAGEDIGSSSSASVTLNQWNHVVITADIANSNVSFYIDGIYKYSDTSFSIISLYNNADADLQIGEYLSDFFNGSIDEVMIFKRALSAQEIYALYNNGANILYNNFTSLTENYYNYTAYVRDLAGNLKIMSHRNVTVDTTSPSCDTATFLPLYGGGSNFSGTAIVNFTCTDTNLYYMNISIYNSTTFTMDYQIWNQWVNAKGNTTYSIYNDSINVSAWVDGTYYVNASVSDVG